MSTKITYNGKEVKLKNGDSAVVESRDKKLLHDIEIKDTTTIEPITITENGVYPVPKGGGGLEYDKEVQCKALIPLEDIYAFIDSVTLSPMSEGTGYLQIIDGGLMALMYFTDIESGQFMLAGGDGAVYAYLFNTEAGIAAGKTNPAWNEDGWWAVNMSDQTATKLSEPPTITIPSGATVNPDLESISFFFDVPGGKSLDGWGEITVNVAGGGIANIKPLTLTMNGTYNVVEGGEIKYNSQAKFKDNITAEDIEAYVANATPSYVNEELGCPVYTITDGWEMLYVDMEGQKGYVIAPPNMHPASTIFALGMSAMGMADGWQLMHPQKHIPAHAPFAYFPEGSAMSADLATTAVLFDTNINGYAPIVVDSREVVALLDHSINSSIDGWIDLLYCEGAKALAHYAFYNRGGIKNVELPNAEVIGQYAFQSSNMFAAKLLKAQEFSDNAFYRAGLQLLILRDIPKIKANLFSQSGIRRIVLCGETVVPLENVNGLYTGGTDIGASTYIYVPKTLVDSYKGATNWTTFADRIRAIEDYPEECDFNRWVKG